MGRALATQALGCLEPVNGVNPVKMLGYQARLVALDGADAVPLQAKVAQCQDFFHCFLHIAFAKRKLPRRQKPPAPLQAPKVLETASKVTSLKGARPPQTRLFACAHELLGD
jgi:hypothetical protein